MTSEHLDDSALSFDVVVIGGGVAGVAAACGAARIGASVAIVEKYGFLGGVASSAWVGTICGAYLRGEGEPRFGVGEFPRSFVESVAGVEGASPIRLPNGLAFLPASPASIDSVSRGLIGKYKIKLLSHSTMTNLSILGRKITSLSLYSYNRPISVVARSVIDCSGEAVVSGLASIPVRSISESQASSLSVIVSGVLPGASENLLSKEVSLTVMRSLKGAVSSILPGSLSRGRAVLKITMGVTPKNSEEVIAEEWRLRELAPKILQILKEEVSEFKEGRILDLTPQLGVRAGATPVGRGILCREDVVAAKSSSEGVANGCWPIERWMPNGSVELTPLAGDFYQIPAGALESSSIDNLWFGGRSFSADEDAIASARVIGTALGSGYAAGQLGASEALGISREQAVDVLRKQQQIAS